MCKVSVIIPTYNNEADLERCVQSVLSGTFSDFELLLINDGSTDSTVDICQRLSASTPPPPIRYYEQPHAGVGAARNKGLSLARGEYIAFIDADDVVEPNYLQTLVEAAEQNHADWVVCGYMKDFVDAPDPQRSFRHQAFSSLQVFRKEEDSIALLDAVFFISPENHLFSCVMGLYRRAFLLDHNLSLFEDISYGEDTLFNFSVAQHCSCFCYCPKPLYHHRIRANASCNVLSNSAVQLVESTTSLLRRLDEMRKKSGLPLRDSMLIYAYVQTLRCYYLLISSPVYASDERKEALRLFTRSFRKAPLSSLLGKTRLCHAQGTMPKLILILLKLHCYRLGRVFYVLLHPHRAK